MSTPHQANPQRDTVEVAAATPEVEQPYAELGLRQNEYEQIREILGRRPTSAELAMYSVMWSEHCSYKSSKVHLRQFGDKAPASDAILVGIGENAGVVDAGDGWAITFKAESHNSPSYVEPYQGAATGVGGIVRDIISMGARPIAVFDSLRMGPLEAEDTARVLPAAVAGIGGYGNSLGVPNVGGETRFHESYGGNPLVNAACIGAMKHEDIHLAKATGAGNLVVIYGAATGGDGIGGASILASESFEEGSETKRPNVQVGDPFMEKLLIECTLEVLQAGCVVGIQDLGAAGISCATSELASNGAGGMRVWLTQVPLRDDTLTPEEILMSESQERMCAVVPPDRIAEFEQICEKWGVQSAVIGEVTEGDRLEVWWEDQLLVDVPPRTVAHDGPVYERPYTRPEWQDDLQANTPEAAGLARPGTGEELAQTLLALLSSPDVADKSVITSQYDHYVLGGTVLAAPEDAALVRLADDSTRGVAFSLDGHGRFTQLDPYAGTQLSFSEAYRNVAVTGAVPLAVTNCLNYGSPENPDVMWQFQQSTAGLADACLELGTPVTGGNVSFYNQTGQTPILPTPVVGVLGVMEDVTARIPLGVSAPEQVIYLLGETRDEFGGSEWAHRVHGHLGGLPPQVDLAAEARLAGVFAALAKAGIAAGAHDLSDGGLAVALAEMVLRHGVGLAVQLPEGQDPFVGLFSESVARAVVAVAREQEAAFLELVAQHDQPVTRLGESTQSSDLTVAGQFTLTAAELRQAYEGVFAELFPQL